MKSIKGILSIAFRVSISIALLIFLFHKVDRKSLLETIKNADKGFLLLAFTVCLLNYVLCLFRWEMLLKALKIHLPLKRVIISFAGGTFFSLFLPSTIGGDLMRSIDLATHTKRPKEVIATVLLDRLSGYIGLVLLSFFVLLLGRKLVWDPAVLFIFGAVTAVLILVLLVLFNRFFYRKINKLLHSPDAGKIRDLIKNLHQEIHFFRHHKEVIVNNILLSLVIQAVSPVTFFITALAIGLKLSPVYFFAFLPLIGAIALLPISLGGLGLRDATVIFFFAKVGVGKDAAFAMSLLNFFFMLIAGIIGGLIYVFTVHHRRVQSHKPSVSGSSK